MKIIKIKLDKISKEQIKLISNSLKKGEVVVLPTDTIYGLSCVANSKKAISKIRCIKNILDNRPFLILVSSLTMAKKYCQINQIQKNFLSKIWPGPVTVIFNSKNKLLQKSTSKIISLAVRLPKNNFLIKIIKKINQPLVSTSLNLSGQKPLASLSGLNKYFKKHQPDLVIDAGKIKKKKPSKIYDIRDINNIKIIRK
ncbi:MAG: L-threonylcarbamoyladenylate synthase [Patescibacteria group bacterium]